MRNVWSEQSNQVWKQLQYSPMKWPQLHFDKLEYPSKGLFITLCGSSNEECFMSFSSALTHRSEVQRDEGFCTGTHWTSKTGKRSMDHLRCDSNAIAVSELVCVFTSAMSLTWSAAAVALTMSVKSWGLRELQRSAYQIISKPATAIMTLWGL